MSEVVTRAERRRAELVALRDRGLSQRRAARCLGISQAALWARCRRLGVSWPAVDVVHVAFRGRRMNLAQLSAATGIAYNTLYRRYHTYGYRGARLVAPVNSARQRRRVYDVGLAQ